jgi:hypothetical protein
MKSAKNLFVACAIFASALALAQTLEVALQANLSGIGKGKVVWKSKDRGTQHEAQLQGEGENLPRNAPFSVTVGSNAPFAVTTDAFGKWRLSQRYTTLTRPTIVAGDSVSVTDGNSVVVQSGTMQVQ